MSTHKKGAFGKVKDGAGNVFDFDKNTKNGIPPIQVGDVFFYRAKGSESAAVTRVRVYGIKGKIALLDVVDHENKTGVQAVHVDLRRVEVVQFCEPLQEGQPEDACLHNPFVKPDGTPSGIATPQADTPENTPEPEAGAVPLTEEEKEKVKAALERERQAQADEEAKQ
jgi:hypothetical protein